LELSELICEATAAAVERNGEGMSDTRNAGVSNADGPLTTCGLRWFAMTGTASVAVPGQWLIYTLLLALPFPAKIFCPDDASPIWLSPPKRKRRGVVPERNLLGMPDALP